MGLCITSNPHLGFATTVDATQVLFTVGVNTDDDGIETVNGLKFSVWHNNHVNGIWSELPLCQFTLKFRIRPGPWQWVKDVYGIEDGHVIFRSKQHRYGDLDSYLIGLNSEFSVQSVSDDQTSCRCWELTSRVPAAEGQKSGQTCKVLGTPIQFLRWFAVIRHNEPWLNPRQGRGLITLDRDGILLSLLRTDGLHLVVISVSGIDDILSVFRSNHQGQVMVNSRYEREEQGESRLFAAIGTSAQEAIKAAMNAVRNFVQSHIRASSPTLGIPYELIAEERCQLTEWYDGFAYCTWNGIGQALSTSKIIGALNSLAAGGINVGNLIIDDNWQSLDYSGQDNFYHRWTGFEANKENFPSGLKGLVSEVRRCQPSIQNIAVWHGIFGYWGGMSPVGDIAHKYSMKKFEKQQDIFLGGGHMFTVDGTDARSLFDDFYCSGMNAVKTDTQSFLDYPEHANDRRNLTNTYQDAWLAASTKYFRGKSIACMAQIPQVIFYSMMRPDLPTIMMRNSDDFFPNEPRSHSWHVFCNAHNAVLTQHLNVLPDWDMFQTDHEFAGFHAAARCLSGGPIYSTDVPGRHNILLIEEMTAKTADGRLVILRPEHIGRTSEIYVAHSETHLLTIQTQHFNASILRVFNVGSEVITELFHLDRFLDISENYSYIVRSHVSGRLFGPWETKNEFPMFELTVPEHGYEIMTAYLVCEIGSTSVAALGLLGKMTGAAAIMGLNYLTSSSHIKVHVTLKALGVLDNGMGITDAGKFLDLKGSILTVDLGKIWQELGFCTTQRSGSDITVVVFIPVGTHDK